MPCALCGDPHYYVLRSAHDVEWESRRRARFVEKRLGHRPGGLEGMDLTEFMHGGPAEIVTCTGCGTIRRNEKQPAHYESDRYDPALMRELYPRYRQAFAQKCDHFQQLLPPRAEVLEVGSHLGAFLEIAETWQWRPIGLDIGRDTSAFARHQGATIKHMPLEDYSPRRRPDAIFIWNCFEQLSDPVDTMIQARSLLSRHGLLVLRVPNANFYRQPSLGTSHWRRALGYNNLLGFPYLNGYSAETLRWLLASSGFQVTAAFAASLLTPPYPKMTDSVHKEWHQTRVETEAGGAANGPWIEIVGRAATSLSVREELKDTGVTITALTPGATETNFFHRADMDDPKVVRGEKDDPADVAKTGFDALMAGDGHVVAGSFENKAQATMAHDLPDTVTAEMHPKQAERAPEKR